MVRLHEYPQSRVRALTARPHWRSVSQRRDSASEATAQEINEEMQANIYSARVGLISCGRDPRWPQSYENIQYMAGTVDRWIVRIGDIKELVWLRQRLRWAAAAAGAGVNVTKAMVGRCRYNVYNGISMYG